MIVCRSLFRVDTVLRVTNNFAISSSARPFQRVYFYRAANYDLKIDIGVVLINPMDRAKLNKASHEWRKVSTQSSSHTGYEVKDGSLASQSSDFGDKGENKEMDDPVVGVNPGMSSLSQYENEVKGEGETDASHGSQLSSVEVRGLKGESTSAENESLAIEYFPSTGRHALTLEVGASLMRFIKGKWGSTQTMIEDETGAQVIFPPSRKDDAITIEGDSAESVTNASRKIKAIIHESVNSPRLDYSHFVSLPLAVHPELVDKLVEFQNSILETSEATTEVAVEPEGPTEFAVTLTAEEIVLNPEDDGDASNKQFTVGGTSIPLVSYAPKRSKTSSLEFTTSKLSDMGIDSSIFIKPKTFHLTVLMLKLWNKERLEAAAKVLQSVSSKVVDALDRRPISIRLKGLECMKGSFAKARVLYVPVEEVGEEGRLLRACQVIIDAFVEAGLVLERDAQHKLKLHATLMNVRHRKRQGERRSNNDFFDASKIAEQYGTMEWGEFVIPQAHLSERFAFDENGYYHCCVSIPFPETIQQQQQV